MQILTGGHQNDVCLDETKRYKKGGVFQLHLITPVRINNCDHFSITAALGRVPTRGGPPKKITKLLHLEKSISEEASIFFATFFVQKTPIETIGKNHRAPRCLLNNCTASAALFALFKEQQISWIFNKG